MNVTSYDAFTVAQLQQLTAQLTITLQGEDLIRELDSFITTARTKI